MKLKLLIACLMVGSNCFSQTLIDKKDDFTGKNVKGATINFMPKSSMMYGIYEMINFAENGNKKTISAIICLPSGQFGAFSAIDINNTSILFKMPNDSIIRFRADPSSSRIINQGANSILAITSEISDDQLTYFAFNKIEALRIAFTKEDTGLDLSVNEKRKYEIGKASAFMEGFKYREDVE